MKERNIVPINKAGYLLTIAGYLLLPCLYGGWFLASWFPYHLAGKQFLAWYIVHMAIGHLLLYLAGRYSSAKVDKLSFVFLWITVLISLSRMCKGLYHHKPILYLCLLTALNVLLLLLWNRKN
ncbi:hypothetical protein [Chitinophaga sp. CF418]|uniref:hypothetical protein n=1 Tax=Chitinophaga sp. CF418 TaxID=1855287 RepID=UPI00091E4104|nr:hypothetical protein [Chitinophaga sp. CF418]SHN44034.1 hypothetical protein SAMN05216311_116181 [Chitinophaga sp. CF418]